MLDGILNQTHRWVAERVQEGGTAVDATVGNGHDTRFLASLVGDSGQVFGFDIQEEAIKRTRLRLAREALEERTILIHSGHQHMQERLSAWNVSRVDAVMFNLGYLPQGDPDIITCPQTTLKAMRQALDLLTPGGILTAVLYTGHPGGEEEAAQVSALLQELDPESYQAVRYQVLNRNHAPVLTAVCKR